MCSPLHMHRVSGFQLAFNKQLHAEMRNIPVPVQDIRDELEKLRVSEGGAGKRASSLEHEVSTLKLQHAMLRGEKENEVRDLTRAVDSLQERLTYQGEELKQARSRADSLAGKGGMYDAVKARADHLVSPWGEGIWILERCLDYAG